MLPKLPKLHSVVFVALALTCAVPASWAEVPLYKLGGAVDASQAERSITIGPETRWANVHYGESVRFVSGQQAFVWKFDGSASSFDLTRVAPAGFMDRPFMVYVASARNGQSAN
jgi:hypothetical protein